MLDLGIVGLPSIHDCKADLRQSLQPALLRASLCTWFIGLFTAPRPLGSQQCLQGGLVVVRDTNRMVSLKQWCTLEGQEWLATTEFIRGIWSLKPEADFTEAALRLLWIFALLWTADYKFWHLMEVCSRGCVFEGWMIIPSCCDTFEGWAVVKIKGDV